MIANRLPGMFLLLLLSAAAFQLLAQQDEGDRKLLGEMRAKAEKGDAKSQGALGEAFDFGSLGVAKDAVEAVKWYRKAAEQNDASAQRNLGLCYERGDGVVQDYAEAMKWYRKAAEQNCGLAQFNLGNCYYDGQGVAQDYAEAVNWFRKAAEQNNAKAQCSLGVCYVRGQGVAKDEVEAVNWFRKAIEQNLASAQYYLGVCYDKGLGVAKDPVEAVKWIRKAAEQNSAKAQSSLGECYLSGRGVAKDVAEALKWYHKAAEQSDSEAQFILSGDDSSPFAQKWIVTNAAGMHRPSTDYIGEYDLTPSVLTNLPNSSAYYNKAARIFLRHREGMVLCASAKATYGGRVMTDYDVRALDASNAATMTDTEMRAAWQTNRPLMKVSYYRGRVFCAGSDALAEEWMTVFTSADRKRIVAVYDSGPIRISENAGSTWKDMNRAGEYEFTLSKTPKGSVLVGVVSLTDELATAAARADQKMADNNWYCAASAANGSQLMLTGGASQSAPALRVTRSENHILIAWPASFTGFVLQASSDLPAPNWADLTNSVELIETQNEVILPLLDGYKFFRLRER